jgi:perosamine synthetase
MKIPLARPSINDEDIESVVKVLRTGDLVQGKNVWALEAAIADYLDVKHAIAVSNGTATLHLSLVALGIGPGDEVIVPAFSFPATANVVEVTGAKCIFVDIGERSFNIDPERIKAVITDRTKAIIPVHEFGLPCRINEITNIARDHGLFVIEDAACALGAKVDGRFAGTFGNAGSFSLHPRKAITSGEGGLLVTNDDDLAETFRVLRNHGIGSFVATGEFVSAGLNYRMTDFQAALVIGQLRRIDAILEQRDRLARRYIEGLVGADLIRVPYVDPGIRHTWQTFHVMLNKRLDRAQIIERLRESGIGSNYGAQCIPDLPYYSKTYALDSKVLFTNAYEAYHRGLALPVYGSMTIDEVDYVTHRLLELTS